MNKILEGRENATYRSSDEINSAIIGYIEEAARNTIKNKTKVTE